MKIRVAALVVAVVVFLALAFFLAGASPLTSLGVLLKGSLGSASAFTGSLRQTTPLLIAGVAVFVALRAGLFNIGAEGQLIMGAMTCTLVALKFPGPAGIVLGTLVAMIAGALWALPAGLIRAYRNGHEVITTIMLNNVGVLLTDYLVAGPIRAPGGDTTTASITDATRLPNVLSLGGSTVSIAVPIGVVLAVCLAYWLKTTVKGFELRAVGANPIAARFAGVADKRTQVSAMAMSGGIAGLAGAIQVLAYEGRFYSGFSPGYGFDALGIALLAGESALALIPAAFLFGALAKGAVALQIDANVPKGITGVVLAGFVLIAAAVRGRGVKNVA